MLLSAAPIDMTVSTPQLGKTLTLALWVLTGAWYDGGRCPWPSWWTGPTYDQAKHGYLNHVVASARSAGILKEHTTTPPLKATLINGSVIEARSWDSPEGLYGPTVARVGSDEFGFLTEDASAAIASRLSEARINGLGFWRLAGNVSEVGGEAEAMYRAATAKRRGYAARTWTWRDRAAAADCLCGLNGSSMSLDTAEAHAATCRRGRYLLAIAERRGKMSKAHFRQLYDAEWVDWSAFPAYSFERAVHLREDVEDQASLPLELSCDFNVGPMAWIVGQHRGNEAWAIHEVVIDGGATTSAACDEFLKLYPGDRKRELVVYGDASGNSHSTKSTETDYEIIKTKLRPHWPRLRMAVGDSNPAVTDRLNAVNACLQPADGSSARYLIHPRCERLANDLARVSLKPGTREIWKTKDPTLTHFSDADGYRLADLFPVVAPSNEPSSWESPMHDNPASAQW